MEMETRFSKGEGLSLEANCSLIKSFKELRNTPCKALVGQPVSAARVLNLITNSATLCFLCRKFSSLLAEATPFSEGMVKGLFKFL